MAENKTTRAKITYALVNLAKTEVSDAAFGRRIGAARQTVSSWMSGEKLPPVERLVEIADEYGVSMDTLCGREVPDALMPDERELLEAYRSMDEDAKGAMLFTARRLHG